MILQRFHAFTKLIVGYFSLRLGFPFLPTLNAGCGRRDTGGGLGLVSTEEEKKYERLSTG